MPSYTSVFRPPAPGIAQPGRCSRREETFILRVFCALAVICVGALAGCLHDARRVPGPQRQDRLHQRP